MKTVLHLERKFTSKTETFIVNQVNTIKNYNVVVATLKSTNFLPCNKKIITPENHDFLTKTGKFLTKETAKNLEKQINEFKIDLIHTHFISDALIFHRLTKNLKVPKICSAYGYDVHGFPRKYFGLFNKLLKKVFYEYDLILAMTEEMKKDLMELGVSQQKIKVHYHGANIKPFIFQKNYKLNNPINILQIGSFEEVKGHKFSLLALNKLKNIGLDFRYNIIGDGRYRKKIEDLIKKLNLSKVVILHGYVKPYSTELNNIIREQDIFLHPSITTKMDKEGVPGAIVEMMASGFPIVSTFHGGIPYIIENEKEGLLVKERDVDGLASAILRLVKDENLREFLGKNAQKKAIEELDLYKGTERLEKIYEKIIGR